MSSSTWCREAPLRPDAQVAVFRTERGRVIQCTVTLNTRVPGGHRYRLFGTEGGAEWFSHEERARVFFGQGDPHAGWTWTRLAAAAEGDDTTTGHGGVDGKLARAFVRAVLEGRPSPIDVYRGADYTLPGIVAAASADRAGAALPIPDIRPQPFAGTRFWDHVPLPERSSLDDVRLETPPR